MNRISQATIIGAATAYAGAIAILWAATPELAGEALAVAGVFAVAFPLTAAALLWRSNPAASTETSIDTAEVTIVGGLLVLVSVVLASAGSIDALFGAGASSGFVHAAVVIARKLIVFVLLPWAVLKAARGRTAADFGLSSQALRSLWGRQGVALAGLVVLAAAFQLLAGSAAQPIRDGTLHGRVLALSLGLSLIWNILEAGLVEEFFFRAVLQGRLALALRSELAGAAAACVLFGIAHAPGYVLRGAAVADGLGANPPTMAAVAYAIAVPSAAGVIFAYLWVRTRNLYVGIILHGSIDAISNADAAARLFGLV